jgi:predicted HTH domain antitoxin
MAITFELPQELERDLRRSLGDLDHAAKEATLVELYRRDQITAHELSRALGLSRLATEALLKKHNVTEDLPTTAELSEALDHLRRITSG